MGDKKLLNAIMEEIKRRQIDYAEHDYLQERLKLIEAWRKAHPECAAEPPSLVHHTLDLFDKGQQPDKFDAPERWENDLYQVTVRRWTHDSVFRTDGGMIWIGISALDGTARHDWREFQGIKNQIAGPEVEGFELYPAESRLLDPSNYYTIWCFPGVKHIKVGINEGRRVLDVDEAMAPQRAFGKSLPRYCYSCGAYLMGGATEHKPDCEIRRMIEEAMK
jgi:hypothetical protein